MGNKQEITNIERLEMMEEKYGVSLEGVYAEYESIDDDSNYINVRAEMQVVNGTNIEEDLSISARNNTHKKALLISKALFNSSLSPLAQ